METLSTDDLQLFREKSRTFCGSVKVPIDKLQHETIPTNPRQFDDKNVARLLKVFEEEKCLRLESDHYVSALISRDALPQYLRSGNIGDFILQEPQFFEPEHPLTYLHGRHRLEAAKKYLAANDRWWVVNLYADDINLQGRTSLREECSNSKKYYDGDIIRHILTATLEGNIPRRRKWLALLSKSKQDDFIRWEKRAKEDVAMREFLNSLEALIPYVGLWSAFPFGTAHRLLTMHCPEEMTRYLRRVDQAWGYIIGGSEGDKLQLDAYTVHLLQGRCPSKSLEDHTYVETQMLKGDILPAIKSWEQRSAILERIYSVEYIIPSIHTFLEDTKYLELGAKILKEILPVNCKYSIAQAFGSLHNGQPGLKLQQQEYSFEDSVQPSGSLAQWMAYRQLWSLSLRQFPWMIGHAPRKDARKPKPKRPNIQPRWWYELASLASESGFQQIRQPYPNLQNVDAEMAENFLREARPPEFFGVEPMELHGKVQAICVILQGIAGKEAAARVPELTSDYDDCGFDIANRCGIPFEKSFLADRQYFFLKYLYSDSYSITPKRYLTSFDVKRDMFHSFFGTVEGEPSPYSRSDPMDEDVPGNVELPLSPQLPPLPALLTPLPSNSTTNEDPHRDVEIPDLRMSPPQDNTAHEDALDRIKPSDISQTFPPLPDSPDSPLQNRMAPESASGDFETPGFGQTIPRDQIVSFAEASRVLGGGNQQNSTFTVLSPSINGAFRARRADPRNIPSMFVALKRPLEPQESQSTIHEPRYLAQSSGKTLKLTSLASIIEEAKTKHLKGVLKVPPGQKVQVLIKRFETEEEL